MRVLLVAAISAALAVSAQAELVANGGFETGNFAGWTQFGDGSFTSVGQGPGASGTHSGQFNGIFGPITAGGVQQNLIAPANSTIMVSFWLAQSFGSSGTSMTATLDGLPLVALVDYTDMNYEQFSATVTTINANPLLQFTFVDPPDFFQLDDVSANIVPEPSMLALAGLGLLATLRRR